MAANQTPLNMRKTLYKIMCMNAHTAEIYGDVTEFFSALATPVRAAIVHRLTERPWSVGELAQELDVSQPLISQHLRVLRSAHLVTSHRSGQRVTYALADEHVAHVFLDAYTHMKEQR